MKYLLESVLLVLIWLFGHWAIDTYRELDFQQNEWELKTQLNRYATELSLETLSATDSNVYHFDEHAQKQLEFERIKAELILNETLSDESSSELKQFHNLVDSYMQLASMLKTSYRYVSKLELEKSSFSEEVQPLLTSIVALTSNVKVANELSIVEAASLKLKTLLPNLLPFELQDNRLRVLRLHVQFILENSLTASTLLLPIREARASSVIINDIDQLNAEIDASYWRLITYSLSMLIALSLLVAVAMTRLMLSLRLANRKANLAAETKSQFLSNMSHEIRTPMNGILGLTDILLGTELTRTQRNYLEKVRFSANSLTTIINDILDFSKIESNKLHIESIPFHFVDLLDNLRTLIAPTTNDKGIQLVFDIDPDLSDQYLGDPVRINQVLLNLCSNAVKFTDQGMITVAIKCEPEVGGFQWLNISVTDTGIGINQSQIDNLFKRFTQAESSTTRKYGGTGLGLSICQLLVELMGGEIDVRSEVGQGSTFSVRLPLSVKLKGAKNNQIRFKGSMLVVEDDPVTLETSTVIAQSLGLDVLGVKTGRQALEVLAERSVDILLLDWVLPDYEGGDLLNVIEEGIGLPEQVVIYSSHSEHFIAMDFDFPVLNKPLLKRDLIEYLTDPESKKLEANIKTKDEKRNSKLIDPANPLSNEKKDLKILLVEDNDINQMIAVTLLEGMGLDVTTASNGQQAVDLIVTEGRYFDLVLMDIQMPVMDGMEATKLIRDKYDADHLGIIALTANVMQEEVDHYLSLGMNGHLGKPFEHQDLEDIIRRHVPMTRH